MLLSDGLDDVYDSEYVVALLALADLYYSMMNFFSSESLGVCLLFLFLPLRCLLVLILNIAFVSYCFGLVCKLVWSLGFEKLVEGLSVLVQALAFSGLMVYLALGTSLTGYVLVPFFLVVSKQV